VATAGSFNNEIGLPLTALRADHTTMHLVLEMGSRGIGHITYLTGLTPPDVGVVINVGSAHLGEFGSREVTAKAKGELIEALPPDGLAVLNADDRLVAAMADRTRARVATFGRHEHAEVRATDVRLDGAGHAAFILQHSGRSADVKMGLVGEHHVSNALAAATVALHLAMDIGDVADALSDARPLSQGRMEITERLDGVTVVNDAYNANPDSTAAALRAIAATTGGRRTIAVLGEMAELGADATAEHHAIGQLVARLGIHTLVAVGGSDAAALQAGADSQNTATATMLLPDIPAAIHRLESELRPGDIVLVKSSKSAGLLALAHHLMSC
jgi:UDP-N-acetylmuramoyl-tripeptide--D-alanyl-D-alanine ligase